MRRLGRLTVALALICVSMGGCRNAHAAVPPLGSAQSLAIGLSVALAPTLDTPTFDFIVRPLQPYAGRVSVLTAPRPGKPPANWRPEDFPGRVILRTSLILDAHSTVPLNGQPYHDVAVRLPGDATSKAELTFSLPPLDPGHHCLVLATIEDARALFDRKRARVDHSSAEEVDIEAGPGPEHCSAPLSASTVPPGNLAVVCDGPLITPFANRAHRGGSLKLGSPAWVLATTHGCQATGDAVMLFRDGRMVTSPGPIQPQSVPIDSQVHEIALGTLPKGSWRVVQVTLKPRRSTATVGPPVLVA